MTRRRTIPVLGLVLSAVLVPASAFASETDAWVSNGPPGASVFAIAPAPSNPATVYAATGRGVWRGQRGGALWGNASAGLPGARVQTLAVDPTNPAVLYAGTITPTGIQSVGIFKSTDGGASWIEANAGLFDPFTQAEPLDVPAISIDPTNPQVLLAGTRFSEIFRSEDGGASWEPQTLGGASLGLETTGFARDPANPQRIYAASSEGLLLSTNGGQDWDFFGDAGISFFTIAVDPSTPSTVWAGNVNNFGVGRSTDSGATWQSANGNLPKVTIDGVDFFPPIRAVAVAPDGSAVYLATQAAGLFQSVDGGATWTALEAGLNEQSFESLAFLPGQPPSTLLVGGSGGGVYRTDDAGASWSGASTGLNEALVSEVVAHPAAAGVAYASAFDGVYATADGAQTWSRASGGLPPAPVAALAFRFVISLQPGDSETLYAGTLGEGLWASVDGGANWTPRDAGLDDDFVSSVILVPTNAMTLYAGTDHPFDGSNPQRVYKSTDAGATWQATGLDAGGFSIDVLAVDPDDSARVAAVSRGANGFFQSTNGGVSWTAVSPGTGSGCGAVRTILYETPGSGILLGVSNGVCRSDDGGASWTHHNVATNASVEDLLADAADPAVITAAASPAFPGGTGGVFRSSDGGATWTPIGTGLSTSAVESLALDDSGESLYAGILRGSVAVLDFGQPARMPEPTAPPDRDTRVIERP